MHLFLYICLFAGIPFIEGTLKDKFHNYELINKHRLHVINKRSIDVFHTKEITISAFGQNFTLELKPSKNLFSSGLKITVINSDQTEEVLHGFDQNNFLTGHVVGKPHSRASLHIDDNGVITGVFTVDGQEFVLEPIRNHIEEDENDYYDESTMVAYRRTDIKTDPQNNGLCGSVHPPVDAEDVDFDEMDFKTFDPNESQQRRKRATSDAKTCKIIAVADFRFYAHYGENNKFTTANYIANIINRVNDIYRNTDFGVGSGYGFELKEMVLHNGANPAGSSSFPYNAAKTWGTTELLQAFGRTTRYSEFCLAHLFTSQAMPDSVLGLAYIASPTVGAAGGLCSPTRRISGFDTALNTGWTSSRNGGGGALTFLQNSLVTAHEFGHNWGSEHDPASGDCAPGTFFDDGKYLMYSYSVTGEDGNNDMFSSCSRGNVGQVLSNKAASCLVATSALTPCGNGRIDTGEKCDGGFLGSVNQDECCNPDCTLRNGAQCSAANYGCCANCQVASDTLQCQSDIEGSCQQASNCNGVDKTCPTAPNKIDGTACLDGGSCRTGVCMSYCEFRALNSCLCDAVETSCQRCCRNAAGECTVHAQNVLLQNGRSCVQGYCENGACKKVATDLIERLWDLIDAIDFDFLVESFKTNMIACVTGFSLILYVPICIIIWCVDRRRKKNWEHENSVHVRTDRGLAHDEDKRPIAAEKPTTSKPRPLTLDPSEYLDPVNLRPNSRNQVQPTRGAVSSSSQA